VKSSRFLPIAAVGIFLAPLVPEIVGARLLVFRDAFITHFPIQSYSLAWERSSQVPFLNIAASNIEPLLANPNTVLLYPTHLLYRLLPSPAAFNVHLLLHVVWAFFGAAALCRRFGAGRDVSWIGGATYAFSGPFLSYGSAFANAAAAAAWAPWAISEAMRLGRAVGTRDRRAATRAMLAVGIAFGLQILAGEPAVSAWTAAAALAAALATSGGRGLLRLAVGGLAAAALAASLAAPQLLATAAAIPYSFRGEHLFSREQFNAAANVPVRAIETIFPLLFGAPRPMASGAFWAYRAFDSLQPYLYSMNFGLAGAILVASALAIRPFRRSRATLALIAAGCLFAMLSAGFRTPLFEILFAMKPLRHFRYPVKFALPSVLCGAILVSLAARRWAAAERPRRALTAVALAAAAILVSTLAAVALARPSIERAIEPQMRGLAVPARAIFPGIARTVQRDCVLGLAAIAVLLVAAATSRRRNRPAMLLGAVLLCLLPPGWLLFVSIPAPQYLARPSLAGVVAGQGRVWVGPLAEFAVAKFGTSHRFRADDVAELIFAGRQEIWPLTGLPDGVAYAFDTDPDGSYGFLDRAMREALDSAAPDGQSRILRNASVRFYLSATREPLPGYRPLATENVLGRTVILFQAVSPVSPVRCVNRTFARSSLSGSIELIRSDRFDPARDAVLRGPDRDPASPPADNRVAGIRLSADGVSADVEAAAPSIAVFAATYFRFWRAAVDGIGADVEIANGAFCGVRVPAGRHRVELLYDTRPFLAGCAGTAAFLAAALILVSRGRSQRSPPARES
jgi:hypothetical protein